MTLKSLIDAIAKLAIEQKCINYSAAGTSIYQLNPKAVKEYPVLFQAPTGNHYVTENYTTYSITLYYLDRLTEDSINDIVIYSAAVEQIKNIVRGVEKLDGVIKVGDFYATNFADTESFDDRLAGAYSTVDITVVNNEICFTE